MTPLIVTHAGTFHADEIMAIILLEKFLFFRPTRLTFNAEGKDYIKWIQQTEKPLCFPLFFEDGIEDMRTPIPVIRTRDASVLKTACQNSSVYVIDVGGEYNASFLNFDHHQGHMTEMWPDGKPLSSTGLIWTWLKTQQKLQLPHILIQDIEDKIIKPLDLHDNGLETSPVASLIATFNRSTDSVDEQNRQFTQAKMVLTSYLDNIMYTSTLKYEATDMISQAWNRAQKKGDTVVLLPKHIDFHDCPAVLKSLSQNQADMIIIPGQGNRFSLISLPLDTPFSIKNPCPLQWRGKMDQTLFIDGKSIHLKFAHKTGFMCIVEGKHSDALTVARHIVDQCQPKNMNRTTPSPNVFYKKKKF